MNAKKVTASLTSLPVADLSTVVDPSYYLDFDPVRDNPENIPYDENDPEQFVIHVKRMREYAKRMELTRPYRELNDVLAAEIDKQVIAGLKDYIKEYKENGDIRP